MTDGHLALRRSSAAVFGNEKLAEVLVFLAGESTPVTAQMVASGTGINYSLVRDALRRLVTAEVLDEMPRVGGSRSPLFYRAIEGRTRDLMTELARALAGERDVTRLP